MLGIWDFGFWSAECRFEINELGLLSLSRLFFRSFNEPLMKRLHALFDVLETKPIGF